MKYPRNKLHPPHQEEAGYSVTRGGEGLGPGRQHGGGALLAIARHWE